MTFSVAVAGCTGYAGGEVLRLLLQHPEVTIGALTGNPLLIAAGSIFAAMTINSILSEASGGKISIASGIAELAKEAMTKQATGKAVAKAEG